MRNKLKTALQNATNIEKARPRNLLGKTDHSAHKIGECQNLTGTKQTEHIKKQNKTQT